MLNYQRVSIIRVYIYNMNAFNYLSILWMNKFEYVSSIHGIHSERVVLPRAASRRGSWMITIASRTQQRSERLGEWQSRFDCLFLINKHEWWFLNMGDPQNHGDSMPTAKNEFGCLDDLGLYPNDLGNLQVSTNVHKTAHRFYHVFFFYVRTEV